MTESEDKKKLDALNSLVMDMKSWASEHKIKAEEKKSASKDNEDLTRLDGILNKMEDLTK